MRPPRAPVQAAEPDVTEPDSERAEGPADEHKALLLQGRRVRAECRTQWRCLVLVSATCLALGVAALSGQRWIGRAPSWGPALGLREERQCTATPGKDVGPNHGHNIGRHHSTSWKHCRKLCMHRESCDCFAWDKTSRGRSCWLKKGGGCTAVHGRDAASGVLSGRCTGPAPAPTEAPAVANKREMLKAPAVAPAPAPPASSPSPLPPGFTEHGHNMCVALPGKKVSGTVLDRTEELTAEDCHTSCELRTDCGCYEFDPGAAPSKRCVLKSPCGNFSDVDEPKVSGSCQICDWCTPKFPTAPDLVIPFYERDLCKMRLTAASIERHDPGHHVGAVHLLWLSKKPPSDYSTDIDFITGIINRSHRTHLHDMSFMLSQMEVEGWLVQQVMKLKVASLVQAPFYVVLDAKNTFIKDIEPTTFMSPCNTGMIYADSDFSDLGEKQDWYLKSADALDVTLPPDRKWSAYVAPVVMHTKTVKDMLGQLSEDATPWELCSGPLCEYIEHGATEVALYHTYVAAVSDERCIHATVQKSPAATLWRGIDGDVKESICDSVAGGERGIVMFGAQSGSDSGLLKDQRQRIAACLSDIYAAAGLHDPGRTSDAELRQCVIGG